MRVLWLVVLAACAHAPVSELRYRNQSPVWRVNDRRPFAGAPKERIYNRALYHADGYLVRRLTRTLEFRAAHRATDVNSLDEVPDSTWFTNRIGVRDYAPDELSRGPIVDPSPFDNFPWTITKSKVGGTSVGFMFEDARGNSYLLKFDAKERPEMSSAAHVIVNRILWACGYNVPQDYLGHVRREDFVIGAKARGNGLTEATLDEDLGKISRDDDGSFRVIASRYLPGKPIGPYAREGTRPDDPNDVFAHEDRRTLRGQYAIFSWLNHTDMQEDNTLDTFVSENGRGYVMHYLIDFGLALGGMGYSMSWQNIGYTYRLDLGIALRSLFTLGLWKRPWEDVHAPTLRGIGLYESEHYDPGEWRANSIYFPYQDKDRFDAFWGSKILIRFTREQLAAIVAEGQLTDPRSAAYLLDTLVERQRKTARYWFDRVAPLDQFRVEPDRLCFTDLTLAYKLRASATQYVIEAYDRAGKPTGFRQTIRAMSDGTTCASGIVVGDYTIVRIRVRRNAYEMPAVFVHLAPDTTGRPQVIGLRRT